MNATIKPFEQLFERYLPYNLQRRFCVLLNSRMDRWSKIVPWKVWEVDSPGVHALPVGKLRSLRDFAALPAIARLSAQRVSVLNCGHASSELREATLSDVLMGQDGPSHEGFVSALDGRFGFVFNHDGGEIILCDDPALVSSIRGR